MLTTFSPTRCAPFVLATSLSCLALGCNQADPMVEDGSSSGADTGGTTSIADDSSDGGEESTAADTEPAADADYFPLADGATWTYQHTTQDGQVWDEVVVMRSVEFNGMPAFEQEDNGNNGESSISTLVRDGTAVMRVHKQVNLASAVLMTAEYDPGFLRFDNGWAEGDSVVWAYDRAEYDANGMLVDDTPRNQLYTVEAMSVEVTVPAGTFDCVQVLRERVETGELKRFWFADGVGKIKHETVQTGATEELSAYEIP